MSEYVPSPWEFFLLTFAIFRTWKLVGDDTVATRPRDWAIKRLGPKFDELIECPWCAPTYLGAAWWLAWLAWPSPTLVFAAFVASLACVGALGSLYFALTDK